MSGGNETRISGYDRGRIEDISRWRDFKPGMWAFYLHRVTGLILSLYLVMHLAVLGTAWWLGPDAFTAVIHTLESNFVVKVLEVGLFGVFVFHALNGIRILLFDLTIGLTLQKPLFYLSFVVSAALVVVSVPFFLLG